MLNIGRHIDYRPLLETAHNIAVVGLSPKTSRPSNQVARYLIDAGYNVIPVNPGQSEIFGLRCYGALTEIKIPVDIVDVFRRPDDVYPVVEAAVKIGAKAVWMQQGIVNNEAAEFARQNGMIVVMDRCIKIDHMNLFPASP